VPAAYLIAHATPISDAIEWDIVSPNQRLFRQRSRGVLFTLLFDIPN
jgi:hypothetical protein